MTQDNEYAIKIFDTTLRDGEQAPGCTMNLKEKLTLARQLEKLKVDVIEAGFAAASPGDLLAIQAIAKEIKDCTLVSLARALKKDIDLAWEGVKFAHAPRIHTFIATSPLHMKYKLKMGPREVLQQVKEAVTYARKYVDDVQFSAEDATRTELEFLYQVVNTAIEAGARVINIPDTVGYSTPQEFYQLLKALQENVPRLEEALLAVHCHNDLGLAVANTLAAVKAGARQLECTINGLGERAGNAALEEVVMALKTRHDFYALEARLDSKEIYKTSRLVTRLTGSLVQANKAIVGANAFAHEAGIHQHGVLANRETYEIMCPSSIGLSKNHLVLGKHSGRHAFEERLRDLGYEFSAKQLEDIFRQFKELADKKKLVNDEDLLALVGLKALAIEESYKLISFTIRTSNYLQPQGEVKVSFKGEEKVAQAQGDGPVDAVFRAIDSLVDFPFTLEKYSIHSVTEGKDAQGEAQVLLKKGSRTYLGRGLSTDIVEASIHAYINGINKILDEFELNKKEEADSGDG